MIRKENPSHRETRKQMGGPSGDVFFNTLAPQCKVIHEIIDSLPESRSGMEEWISPSDRMIGKVHLHAPMTMKYIKATTHLAIQRIGGAIQQLKMDEAEKTLEFALAENEEHMKFMSARQVKESILDAARQHEADIQSLEEEFKNKIKKKRIILEDRIYDEMNAAIEAEHLKCAEQMAYYVNHRDSIDEMIKHLHQEFEQELEIALSRIQAEHELKLKAEEERTLVDTSNCHQWREDSLRGQNYTLQQEHATEIFTIICNERARCSKHLREASEFYENQLNNLRKALQLEENSSKEPPAVLTSSKHFEQKIKAIVAQFQKFINFALNAVPGQADFLLSLENMLFCQLDKVLSTEISFEIDETIFKDAAEVKDELSMEHQLENSTKEYLQRIYDKNDKEPKPFLIYKDECTSEPTSDFLIGLDSKRKGDIPYYISLEGHKYADAENYDRVAEMFDKDKTKQKYKKTIKKEMSESTSTDLHQVEEPVQETTPADMVDEKASELSKQSSVSKYVISVDAPKRSADKYERPKKAADAILPNTSDTFALPQIVITPGDMDNRSSEEYQTSTTYLGRMSNVRFSTIGDEFHAQSFSQERGIMEDQVSELSAERLIGLTDADQSLSNDLDDDADGDLPEYYSFKARESKLLTAKNSVDLLKEKIIQRQSESDTQDVSEPSLISLDDQEVLDVPAISSKLSLLVIDSLETIHNKQILNQKDSPQFNEYESVEAVESESEIENEKGENLFRDYLNHEVYKRSLCKFPPYMKLEQGVCICDNLGEDDYEMCSEVELQMLIENSTKSNQKIICDIESEKEEADDEVESRSDTKFKCAILKNKSRSCSNASNVNKHSKKLSKVNQKHTNRVNASANIKEQQHIVLDAIQKEILEAAIHRLVEIEEGEMDKATCAEREDILRVIEEITTKADCHLHQVLSKYLFRDVKLRSVIKLLQNYPSLAEFFAC